MKKRIEILFQDEFFIAVHKPAGILVHPYKQRSKDRRSLMRSLKKQTGLFLHPVHRLDNQVSGVVLFALSPQAHREVSKTWADESTQKKYYALVRGQTQPSATLDFPLTNDKGVTQEAKTEYKTIHQSSDFSFVDVKIHTGRMHQIRKHFSRRMNNLVGDVKYGNGQVNKLFRFHFKFFRIFLHSYELSFIHPFSKEQIKITCPLPCELLELKEKHINGELDNLSFEKVESSLSDPSEDSKT